MKIIFLFTLFILSRILFLNPQPVFFDAPEYLTRLGNQNLLQALASGHPPFHAGYILIFWPIWQAASRLNLSPILYIEFFTVILGFLTIFVFYLLVKILFDQKVALWSSLFASLVPYFWISNVSVLVEAPYIFFFILSLYLFVLYLKGLSVIPAKAGIHKNNYLYRFRIKCGMTKNVNFYLLFSALSFGVAYFIHTIIIVWLAAFVSCYLLFRSSSSVILRERKRPKNLGPAKLDRIMLTSFARFFSANWRIRMTRVGIVFLTFILFFYLGNVFLLYFSQLFSLKDAFFFVAFGKTNEHLSLFPLITLLPRLGRNWLILLLRSNTNLLTLLFFISLWWLWIKKEKRLFWALFLWFLPSIITNQWWDSVLLGRHGIVSSFPIAIAVAYVFNFRSGSGMILTLREDVAKLTIILYLLIASLGTLWLLRQPIPYLEEAKAIKKLPVPGLLLETHFARPWVKYEGRVIFINEPGWTGDKLIDLINQTIKNEQPVFATTQALADPYGLYCGPYLNPLSLNPKGESELKYLFNQYSFEKIAVVDEKKNLFIWQIKPKTTAGYFYQDFKVPYKTRQRLDFFDPLTQLWFLLVKYF